MSKLHDLKILKEYFDAKLAGIKPFEIRYNDRDFQVGDYLRLREIVPIPDTSPVMYEYTGRVLITEVLYILKGVGLQDGYVALGERQGAQAGGAPHQKRKGGSGICINRSRSEILRLQLPEPF